MNFMRLFYGAGALIFLFSNINSVYNLVMSWGLNHWGNRASSMAMIFFYFLIVYVFYDMYRQTPKTQLFKEDAINKLSAQYEEKR